MADVVVFPWDPATETKRLPSSAHASALERCHTSMPSSRARASSSLLSRTAVEITTTVGTVDQRSVVAQAHVDTRILQRRKVSAATLVGAGHRDALGRHEARYSGHA